MSDQSTFIDPLEDIMKRHQNVMDGKTPVVDTGDEEDIYGVNDRAKQEAAELEAEEAARQAKLEQMRAEAAEKESLKQMPPQSLDPAFQAESINFQTTNLEIVSRMVDEVAKKHNLTSGGIPESTDNDPDLRMHVMGDLMEQYHLNGEVITPEFEAIVLNNWSGYVDPALREDEPEEVVEEQKPVDRSNEPAEINIHVEKGSPVTVNVDESIVNQMTQSAKINVRVIEVSEEQMRSAKVIMNSQMEGIITPYVSETGDVPLALPLSAYRCVIRPVNYWQFIELGSPMSGNRVDVDKKQWSIIFEHLKNASIGDFKDFEDFLKKTKYADRELLTWGILIGATQEEETVTIRCGNPKCRAPHEIKYNPRSIIHVDDNLAEKYEWKTTQNVAPGQAAIEHFQKINSTTKCYELPHTKYLVEIDTRPSAYDFLNRRFPLMDQLRERFIDQGVEEDQLDENTQYNYLLAQALFITSISKVVNGQTYRYTNWDDIEKIITTSLDMNDAAILFQLVQKLASETFTPISFYLENITCDKCGRHDERIPIPDIGQTLIFQLSQRLSSTEINLTEMEQN